MFFVLPRQYRPSDAHSTARPSAVWLIWDTRSERPRDANSPWIEETVHMNPLTSSDGPISVGVLEDHLVVRDALERALEEAGFSVRFGCTSAEDLMATLASKPVDVLLLDLCLGRHDATEGVELVRNLRESNPSMRVVVLTGVDGLDLASASMGAGAFGFVTKSSASTREVVEAVAAAARGERRVPVEAISQQGGLSASRPLSSSPALHHLTDRERQVLASLGEGHDNLKIAALLGITERTVKAHVSSLYRKLDVENRVQLALVARKASLGSAGATPTSPGR